MISLHVSLYQTSKKNQMKNSLLLSLTRVSPAEQLKQGISEAPSLINFK
jgi:hypothetical protein